MLFRSTFAARLLSTSVVPAYSYSYFAGRQTEELRLLKFKEISRDSDLDPPALKPSARTSFLSSTFPGIPKSPIQATPNSPHLVGFQAHLMDHITMASASAPLSQYGTETRMDIQKEAY